MVSKLFIVLTKIVVVVHQQIQLFYFYSSLFECCHSILVALSAFVSSEMTTGRSQTTFTFNHSIQIRASFGFVMLIILFHAVNDFGFVVIIVLLPGFRWYLPV